MDLKAVTRLRLIGIFVLAVCGVLLFLPNMAPAKYDDAIASTLAIGIGLLLLAEVGPAIKSFKAGGVEIELLDTVTGKFNTLEKRIAQLELGALHAAAPAGQALRHKKARPDALDRPITQRDDPHPLLGAGPLSLSLWSASLHEGDRHRALSP